MTWLNDMGCRNCRHLNHLFADATEMAKILKQLFPDLVQLHNYDSCCKMESKLNNWNTLNKRVLKKIKLQQSEAQILALAKGTPGAIDKLLLKLMELNDKKNMKVVNKFELPLNGSINAQWKDLLNQIKELRKSVEP